MKREISKRTRRIGVIINYASLVLFIIVFYAGEYRGWDAPTIIGGIIALVVAFLSFIYLYVKTHLWKFVHTSIEKLDERQVHVIHDSLRYSYSIFSILSLSYILVLTLTARFSINTLTTSGKASLGMIMLGGLIYLAHTLPASIIAWNEREVFLD